MGLIIIGRVVKPHGIDGTLKVYPLTDFPQHFKTLKQLFFINKEDTRSVTVEKVKYCKRYVLLKIKDCLDRESAEGLVGAEIAIDSGSLWPLGDDEYYYFQILGLKVITDKGMILGEVEDILSTGSNDVFVIRREDKEFLIPAIKDCIKRVDLKGGVIFVHLLEGLIDDI